MFELDGVDGKKVTLTRAQMVERAKKYTAADERFREAKYTSDQVNELIVNFKNDPVALASKLGMTEEALFDVLQKRKQAKIDESKMTPEQKELAALRRDKAERDAAEKKTKEEKQEKLNKIKHQVNVEGVSKAIKSVLTTLKLGDDAKSVAFVAREARDLLNSADADALVVNGKFKMNVFVERLVKRATASFGWATRDFDPEVLLTQIPAEKMDLLLKAYLKKKGGAENKVAEFGTQKTFPARRRMVG